MVSKQTAGRQKARSIAKLASEKKGQDIVLLDLRGLSSVCDWFILISASSTRRLNAISESIQQGLSKTECFPLHTEGRNNPYWLLMDYADVVVHIFHKDVRGFYGLERLWSDAPREYFDARCSEKTFRKKSRESS